LLGNRNPFISTAFLYKLFKFSFEQKLFTWIATSLVNQSAVITVVYSVFYRSTWCSSAFSAASIT